MKIGLRIDVDTFRGTRLGVPALSRLLAEHGIRGTFFFTVGPDNMGRHVTRLVRPSFLWKMLRSRAPGLYGWDILLRGTLWPGPRIGERLAPVIRAAERDGHEVGLHAWDHHAWQAHLDSWDCEAIEAHLRRGVSCLTEILGRAPTCSAAPAWQCNDRVLRVKQRLGFEFNSDCRGSSVFRPTIEAEENGPAQPQVPTTLPTYDELVGRDGITAEGYYRRLLSLLEPGGLNVLAIHAEVEGLKTLGAFAAFVGQARAAGWSFVTLGALAAEARGLPAGRLERASVPGRSGWVSRQAPVS